MRNYDFTPLYRSFVGLDRMADLIDTASRAATAQDAYPPYNCLLYTSPSPRDGLLSRMPSSA